MGQYFTNDPSVASKRRTLSLDIANQHLLFQSDNGVFSKNKIDEGSEIFLRTLEPLHLSGNILDLGCGYGPIGLTMAIINKSASVALADVNTRALELCKENAKNLGLSNRVTILQSDVYSNIEGTFDAILINPPIRAGKKVTYAMYEGAYERLNPNGSLYIVIRKAQGAESASEYIKSLFGNVTLLNRKKGYHIYQATKIS